MNAQAWCHVVCSVPCLEFLVGQSLASPFLFFTHTYWLIVVYTDLVWIDAWCAQLVSSLSVTFRNYLGDSSSSNEVRLTLQRDLAQSWLHSPICRQPRYMQTLFFPNPTTCELLLSSPTRKNLCTEEGNYKLIMASQGLAWIGTAPLIYRICRGWQTASPRVLASRTVHFYV